MHSSAEWRGSSGRAGSHAACRIAGHRRCGSLASRVVRGGDRRARRAHCEGGFVARLDATPACAGDRRRQEQAPGLAGLSGGLAAGKKASLRAGDVPILPICRESSSHAENRIPLPADRPCRRGRPPMRSNARPRASASADLSNASLAVLDGLATRIGDASRAATMRTVGGLSRVPLIGSIVASYARALCRSRPAAHGEIQRKGKRALRAVVDQIFGRVL